MYVITWEALVLLFHSANGRSYPSIPFPEIVSDSLSPVRHLGIALIRPFLLVQCYFFYKLLYFRCDGGNGFISVRTKNISFPRCHIFKNGGSNILRGCLVHSSPPKSSPI